MAEKERNDDNTGKSEGKPGQGKRILLRTFGCQMNTRDSELVVGLLLQKGYSLADAAEEADIILFNTCSVRQHAEDKVWSEIGKLKHLKDDHSRQNTRRGKALGSLGRKTKDAKSKIIPRPSEEQRDERPSPVPRKIIGLIGCMAEHYQEAAFAKSPLIDLVAGPNNIDAIPGLLEDLQAGYGKALAVGKSERDALVYNTEYIAEKSHCNVNIMEGCNNFCSYCIVPYVRGRERSRPVEDIISEIKVLVAKGVKEITLLGQNVNSYGSEGRPLENLPEGKYSSWSPHKGNVNSYRGTRGEGRGTNFVDLLRMVNDIEGLEKFDFVTSHPKDASKELFQAMAELEKCRKFLHLPVQSGSDRILQEMRRGYTRCHYLDLVRQARTIIPGLRLSTDVMVGFPGETDKDFQDTFELMKEARFESAYIFKYSPRPRTQTALVPDDVPLAVKKERNQILLEYQKSLHRKKAEEEVKSKK